MEIKLWVNEWNKRKKADIPKVNDLLKQLLWQFPGMNITSKKKKLWEIYLNGSSPIQRYQLILQEFFIKLPQCARR